jgi:hypothetical protein
MDGLGVAATDGARQDTPSGMVPEIGVEQRGEDAALRLHLQDQGDIGHQPVEAGEMRGREAAWPVRRERRGGGHATREAHRQHHIIGRAQRLDLAQHREVELLIGRLEPAPHRAGAFIDHPDRALQIGGGDLDAMLAVDLAAALAAPPHPHGGQQLRMEGADMQGGAKERDAGPVQRLPELLQEFGGARDEPPFAQDPVADALDVRRLRQLDGHRLWPLP